MSTLGQVAGCPDCSTPTGTAAVEAIIQKTAGESNESVASYLRGEGSSYQGDDAQTWRDAVSADTSADGTIEARPMRDLVGEPAPSFAGDTVAGDVARTASGDAVGDVLDVVIQVTKLPIMRYLAITAGGLPVSDVVIGAVVVGPIVWDFLFGGSRSTAGGAITWHATEWYVALPCPVNIDTGGTGECLYAREDSNVGAFCCQANGWWGFPTAAPGSAGGLVEPYSCGVGLFKGPQQIFRGVSSAVPGGATLISRASPPPEPATDGGSTASYLQAIAAYLNQHLAAARWFEHELSPRCNADPARPTVVVPAILPDETPQDYQDCLTSLGLRSTVTSLSETDQGTADGAVTEALPEPGDDVEGDTVVQIAANPAQPIGTRDDPRCDVDSGSGAIGDPGDAPADGTRFAAYQLVEGSPYFAIPDAAQVRPSETSIPLRWGAIGWGWRHILLKHPFTAADRQQTEQALATDIHPTLRYASTNQWLFRLNFPMSDGLGDGGTITCVRTVSVEFYQDKGATAAGLQGIRGIQNSYAGIPIDAGQ